MTPTPVEAVSEREAEVLTALGGRLTNAQIANRLHLSVRTVEGHVSSLLRKFGVSDRRALAELALPAGPPRPRRVVGVPHTDTSFVGRVAEVERTTAALTETRLVTLLGPGGVGKTRLAAAVAEAASGSFTSGGAFVDLVPVRDGFVAQAVAGALGVTEQSRLRLEDAIAARLRGGRSLLVLDNCEHVVDLVADLVAWLLTATDDVTVLNTSRERLGVPGERCLTVEPLPLTSDAERLFTDRANAVFRGFTAAPDVVTEICTRLDGMPLAIELAAARTASLGAEGILAATGDMLRLLAGSRHPDERHRSLRALLSWSYDLLEPMEQSLFRRLGVFVGPFDLDAACAVTGIGHPEMVVDLLGRLVDKSLVTYEGRGTGRWRLLDTVRAYALGLLESNEDRDLVVQRHLAWAAATAGVLEGRIGNGWRDDFDSEVDDFRAALAASPTKADAVAHRLARSLGHLTYARRFLMESLRHYTEAARRAPTPGEAAADLLSAAACARVSTPSGEAWFELLLAGADRAREAGEGTLEAVALARAVETVGRNPALFPNEIPRERLRELLDRAAAAGDPANPAVAAWLAIATVWIDSMDSHHPDPVLAERAVAAARETGDPVIVSAGLDALGTAVLGVGRLPDAARTTAERLTLLSEMDRDDPYSAPEILDTLAVSVAHAIICGDLPNALAAARAALDDDLLGDRSYLSISGLIPPLVLTGDFDEALRYGDIVWSGWNGGGRPATGWLVPPLSALALAHGLVGDRRAYRLWRARVAEAAGMPEQFNVAPLAFADARVAVHTSDLANAPTLVARAFADFPGARYVAYARAAGAELAIVAGLPDAVDRLSEAAALAGDNAWAAPCVTRAEGRLKHDEAKLREALRGFERIGARFERAATMLLLPDHADAGRAELTALGA